MRNYVYLIIALLTFSTVSIAQGDLHIRMGKLVSTSENQVVINHNEKDLVSKINKDTRLLDNNRKKISISEFKIGEDITVTTAIDSNVALQVRKGTIDMLKIEYIP